MYIRLTDRMTPNYAPKLIGDVIQNAVKLKWDWVGYVCRMSDGFWA